MGGSSSSSSDQVTTIRFAPYIESRHASAIDRSVAAREAVINDSPYAAYAAVSADNAFFSLGFQLSSFPSLYDTFGKNLAGLDIDSLFSSALSDKMASTEEAVESELAIIDDSINQAQEEKIAARDLNATNGSTFIIAQANIESDRIKKTTEFRLAIKYSLIPGIVSTWNKTLSWDKSLVTKYAESLRDYYLCKISADETGYRKTTEDAMWPVNVLGFERDMLAAMTGSRASRVMTERERSTVSKALLVASYTFQGAQIGSRFPPYGTIIGAVIGFVIGMAVMLLE